LYKLQTGGNFAIQKNFLFCCRMVIINVYHTASHKSASVVKITAHLSFVDELLGTTSNSAVPSIGVYTCYFPCSRMSTAKSCKMQCGWVFF